MEWVDPPKRRGCWVRVCEELQTRPGQWALVDTYPTSRRAEAVARSLRSHSAKVAVRKADGEGFRVVAMWPE
jgi:hypothetical protein